MNKIIIAIMMVIAALISIASAVYIEDGDRIYFACNNNQTGGLEGTTANLTCYDGAGNQDVANAAATNVVAGQFYYVFSETDDRYFCYIDCQTASSVDYAIPVCQGCLLQVTDNIGINLDDASGTLDASEIGANAIGASELAADAVQEIDTQINNSHGSTIYTTATGFSTHSAADVYTEFTSGSNEDAFKADVSALATQAHLTNVNSSITALIGALNDIAAADVWSVATRELTTADWTTDADLVDLCYQANLSSGLVVLTSATETQIDNIEADTDEIQKNQSNFITADISALATQAHLTNVNTSIITQGDSAWATATGFTTSADLVDVCYQANLTSGLLVLTSTTEGQIDNIEADTNEIQSNQSNFITADVSALATTTQVANVNSSIISRGDSAWVTAVVSSLATATQVTNVNTSVTGILNDGTYGLSALKTLIDALNDITAADVWSVATRTLTSFGGVFSGGIGISGKSLNESLGEVYNVTINQQAGYTANWSDTSSTNTSLTETDVVSIKEAVVDNITSDHGTGLYNSTGGTATISASDKDEIKALVVANITSEHGSGSYQTATGFSTHNATDVLAATATCTGYTSTSLGCTVWSTEHYCYG